jgi:peroxiredoxin
MKQLCLLLAATVLLYACGDRQPEPTKPSTDTTQGSQGTYRSISEFKSQATKPDIKVQIDGLSGGGYAYLIGTFLGQNFRADSAAVSVNGQLNFKADEPYHPGHYYLLLPNGSNFQLLIDVNQQFSIRTNLSDLAGALSFEGSIDNDLLYQAIRFEESQRPGFAQISQQLQGLQAGTEAYRAVKDQQNKMLDERKAFLDDLFAKHPNTLFTQFKRAGQNPDVRDAFRPNGTMDTTRYTYLFRTRFWDGVDFNDERLLYTPVVSNKLKRYINELTVQQPDSIVAAAYFLVDQTIGKKEFFKYFANWIVINYDPKESTLMDAQAVFVRMIEKYFTYERAFWADSVEVYGLQLRAYEMSASLVGKKGPDVQAPDPSGKLRSIYEMTAPYIIVYMWNPDCEHCAEQTPKLVANYPNWKKDGIDVYGIAVNTEDDKWKAAIQKYRMPWVNVFDPTNKSIYGKYYVDNTPEVYVLNPDRTIIGKNLQVDQIMIIIDRDRQKRGK